MQLPPPSGPRARPASPGAHLHAGGTLPRGFPPVPAPGPRPGLRGCLPAPGTRSPGTAGRAPPPAERPGLSAGRGRRDSLPARRGRSSGKGGCEARGPAPRGPPSRAASSEGGVSREGAEAPQDRSGHRGSGWRETGQFREVWGGLTSSTSRPTAALRLGTQGPHGGGPGASRWPGTGIPAATGGRGRSTSPAWRHRRCQRQPSAPRSRTLPALPCRRRLPGSGLSGVSPRRPPG